MASPIASYVNFSIQGLFYFYAGCVSLLVGLIVLTQNPKSKLNFSFFLITLTGSVWLLCYTMIILSKTDSQAYLWLSLDYLLAVPYISIAVYLFTVYLIEEKPRLILMGPGMGLAVCLALVMFIQPQRFFELRMTPWGRFNYLHPTGEAWVYYGFILLLFTGFAWLGFLNLIRGLTKPSLAHSRHQIKIFLLAFIIGYTGSIDFIAVMGWEIYPFGYISFTIFALTIAYAIIKHKFWDAKIALRRLSFIVLIYGGLLAFSLPLMIPFVSGLVKGSSYDPFVSVLLTGLAFALILSSGPFIYAYFVRHSYWLRGHLTTGLTHELKSPLSTIQASIEVALDQLNRGTPNKEKAIDYLEQIKRNADRLDHFVHDLLNVALEDQASVQLNRSVFNLTDLIAQTMSHYSDSAQAQKTKINLTSKKPIPINADRDKIQQALSNLLSNAVKFTQNGTITVRADVDNTHANVIIQDTGRGLPPNTLNKIFDKFYQASPNTKGTGIGLNIARTWIEAHGGKIWAESKGEGKGTKITFTLPI